MLENALRYIYVTGIVCHIPVAILKLVCVRACLRVCGEGGSSAGTVYTTCEPTGIDKLLWSDKILIVYFEIFRSVTLQWAMSRDRGNINS